MPNKRPWENEPKIEAWKQRLGEAGCTIRRIKPLNLLYKKNGDLLFAFVESDVVTSDGKRLVPYCFIRGDACIVVPLLRNRDTREERFLMIEIHRIGHGSLSLEFPAGMLDNEMSNPADVAVRELFEETGLRIDRNMLHPLTNKPLSSSAGASDETVYYYGCIVDMKNDEYASFEGRIAGSISENEHIRVTLKSEEDALERVSSLQARMGFVLFKEYLSSIETGR